MIYNHTVQLTGFCGSPKDKKMQLDSFATQYLKDLQRRVNEARAKEGLKPLTQSQLVGELIEQAATQSTLFVGSVFVRK